MIRAFLLVFVGVLLAGCFSKPSPDWLIDSSYYMDNYKIAKLEGDEINARLFRDEAEKTIKKSGEIYYLQLLELTTIALDQVLNISPDFTALDQLQKIESFADTISYRNMLQKSMTSSDIDSLPKVYRSFAKELVRNSNKNAFLEAKKIKDNISKLIAMSLIVDGSDQDIEIYDQMIEISKQNGFYAVIIASLNSKKEIYQNSQNSVEKAKIEELLEALKR